MNKRFVKSNSCKFSEHSSIFLHSGSAQCYRPLLYLATIGCHAQRSGSAKRQSLDEYRPQHSGTYVVRSHLRHVPLLGRQKKRYTIFGKKGLQEASDYRIIFKCIISTDQEPVDCTRLALDALVQCTAVSKNKVLSDQCFAADNRDDVIPYISN